jgi:hypothetical protein
VSHAPIVVELAASEPVDPDLSRALVDACAAAAGPGGCVIEGDESIESRARVVVSFFGADAAVRVEVLTPIADRTPRSREVSFRDDDPRVERFRAAGLIAAGLVSDLAMSEHPGSSGPPPPAGAPIEPPGGVVEPRSAVVVRLGGQTGWNGARPWAGAELGADLAITGPAFVALSGSYDQTWERDPIGIAAQRAALGVGAGVAMALGEHLEMRVRLGLDLQELRASIRQPTTLLEDSAGRTLRGIDAGVDLVLPLTGSLGVFGGGRVDWWGGETTVRVQGSPAETVGPWMLSVALGLNVRLR